MVSGVSLHNVLGAALFVVGFGLVAVVRIQLFNEANDAWRQRRLRRRGGEKSSE
jgi:hypothetical protein